MIAFSAKILRVADKGGWSYIEISKRQAEQLNPGHKRSFRVKGKLDNYKLEKTSLLPIGQGKFMLPINAAMRKGTGKKAGDTIKVQFELDKRPRLLSADLIGCLKDDPQAYDFFKTLTKSHQHYFSQWIESAKTINTKTKRIMMSLTALSSGQGFSEMINNHKDTKYE